jgi:hypothetical protein
MQGNGWIQAVVFWRSQMTIGQAIIEILFIVVPALALSALNAHNDSPERD